MLKAVLEDTSGSVPVAIFASLYEKVQGWVREELPVLALATVRESGGAMELTVQEISPLEGIRERRARELAIRVNLAFADENVLARLQERLRSPSRDDARLDPPRPPGRVRGDAQGRRLDADRAVRPADERDPGARGRGVRRVRLLSADGAFHPAARPRSRACPGRSRARRGRRVCLAAERGETAYLVGGAVRDLLLGPRASGTSTSSSTETPRASPAPSRPDSERPSAPTTASPRRR